MKFAVGDDPIESAFELADILRDVFSDIMDGFSIYFESFFPHFRLEDGDACLIIRTADIGDHTSFETRAEPVFECGDGVWRAVARDDDLLIELVEGVKDMEKLGLSLFSARKELDIIDDEEIDALVIVLELIDFLIFYGIDELGREAFRGDIFYLFLRMVFGELIADRLEEMCFPEPDAAIDEEGVVHHSRVLGDREACRPSELVIFGDDEVLEGISVVEIGMVNYWRPIHDDRCWVYSRWITRVNVERGLILRGFNGVKRTR